MKNKTISILCALLVAEMLFSVPALRDIRNVKQTDGKELSILLQGDEHFHYTTTEDGFLITKNTVGDYEYATMDKTGTITSKGIQANNPGERKFREKRFLKKQTKDFSEIIEQKRSSTAIQTKTLATKQFPISGTPRSLVILVSFSNKEFTISNPQQKFTNLLNEEGYATNGGTGSARDYFSDNSYGKFTPQFDVVGPFQLDNTYAYYGANVNNSDKNPRQMVVDACTKALAAGVKFSDYDTDNDGKVDNIFIYYAGYNEAEGGPEDTVWPHRWVVSTSLKFDGKSIYDYACTSELKGRTGSTMCGIGTFCHEFGHVLGLPDFYATNGASHHTLGSWDVMDYGPYNNAGRTPPYYSAYERFALGWMKPTILKDSSYVTLDSLATSNTAFLIAKDGLHNLCGGNPIWQTAPLPNEFFLLENRQKTGWDTYLGGHGMLITHINYNKSAWNSNTINNDPNAMGCNIVEADGLANNGTYAGDPFPGNLEIRSFFPTLKDGTDLNQPLTYIIEEKGLISFRFKGGGNGFPFFDEKDNLHKFNTLAETPSDSQEVIIIGRKLDTSYKISFKNGNNYQWCRKGEQQWDTKTFTINPVDSTIQDTLLVRYFPMIASFDSIHADTILIKCDTYTTLRVPLQGQSQRPIKVEVPVATEANNVTSYSFTANWNAAYDATGYYVSVYSEQEGTTNSLSEGFKTVLNDTLPFDWYATFTRRQTEKYGKASPSIPFNSNNDTLVTERYLFPINKISFWLYNFSSGGSDFKIEGFDGTNWVFIENVAIKSTDNIIEKSLELPVNNSYSRFRFSFTKEEKGMLYFDDFTVYFTKNINYVERHKFVSNLNYVVSNVFPETEYKYYVQATDRTFKNGKILYANITNASNEITTTTLASDNPHILMVRTKSDNSGYIVKIDESFMESDKLIYIYSVQGQLFTTVKPSSTIVEIPNLPRNNFYILRYSERGNIRHTDPTAKLFYQVMN